MRLSDIMSRLDLSIYPQIALVIFLVVFVCVMIRAFSRSRAAELDHAASLPLEDDAPTTAAHQHFRLNGSKP